MSDIPKQCPSCGGFCGGGKGRSCQYMSDTFKTGTPEGEPLLNDVKTMSNMPEIIFVHPASHEDATNGGWQIEDECDWKYISESAHKAEINKEVREVLDRVLELTHEAFDWEETAIIIEKLKQEYE